MTTLWFAGAENSSHHYLFELCSVDRVALNVGSFHRNYKTSWTLGFPVHEWVAWSDTPSSLDDLLEVIELMGTHPVAVISAPGQGWESHQNFLPLWNGEDDFPSPSVGTPGLFVTDRVFSDKDLNRRVLAAKRRESVLGVVTGKSRNIERYDTVITNAWWSAMKHGETQIWDGTKLNRFNANNKTEVRSRMAEHIAAIGVNEWDVIADDPTAVACCAIKSWQAFEAFRLDPLTEPEVTTPTETDSKYQGSESVVVDTRQVRERHVLPSMKAFEEIIEDSSGNVVESTLLVGSSFESIRKCNNCFLSSACPAYQPDHSCAYSIPVEIKTKDQLQNVMQAMVEIQSQRVFQSRFSEEVSGQELAAETGREMDRLFEMIKKMRDIMDNRDTLKVSIEGRGSGSGGILSKLFGEQVGHDAKVLSTPVSSDGVIDVIESD